MAVGRSQLGSYSGHRLERKLSLVARSPTSAFDARCACTDVRKPSDGIQTADKHIGRSFPSHWDHFMVSLSLHRRDRCSHYGTRGTRSDQAVRRIRGWHGHRRHGPRVHPLSRRRPYHGLLDLCLWWPGRLDGCHRHFPDRHTNTVRPAEGIRRPVQCLR